MEIYNPLPELHLPDTIRAKISDEPGVLLEPEQGLLPRDVYVLNKYKKSKRCFFKYGNFLVAFNHCSS